MSYGLFKAKIDKIDDSGMRHVTSPELISMHESLGEVTAYVERLQYEETFKYKIEFHYFYLEQYKDTIN